MDRTNQLVPLEVPDCGVSTPGASEPCIEPIEPEGVGAARACAVPQSRPAQGAPAPLGL